jgi:hypothetical protein
MLKTFWLLTMTLILADGCGSGAAVKADENSVKPGIYQKDKLVLFVYKASRTDVTNVALTGDFDGWASGGHPMQYDRGIWKISMTLDPGTYQYKYILNQATYVPDPTATASAPDGKGGKNSVLEVLVSQ